MERANLAAASVFLAALVEVMPDQGHPVLTDNGIEHRLTKPNHPRTNGQLERMNGTIKGATLPTTADRKPN